MGFGGGGYGPMMVGDGMIMADNLREQIHDALRTRFADAVREQIGNAIRERVEDVLRERLGTAIRTTSSRSVVR
jgi:hypothetical protein